MHKSIESEWRCKKAAEIAANPRDYKICEGCDSIVGHEVILCPNCHSFRFENEQNAVVKQAKILGRRAQRSVTTEDLE